MSKRAVGVYPGENDVILVNFESGQKGVPLKSLLPEKARGDGFEDFDVSGYFSLAQIILVTPEDLQAFSHTTPRNNTSVKGHFPPINPQELGLCTPDGNLNPDQTAQVFSIVAAYWENPKGLAVHSGFVATALRKGLAPKEILELIRQNTQLDPRSGEPKWVVPEFSPQEKLLGALLPPDIPASSITRTVLENLSDWLSAAPRSAKDFSSQRRKVTDLAFLGLMDFENRVDFEAAAIARDYIWDRIEEKPNFKGLWRHLQVRKGIFPEDDPNADYNAYNEQISEMYDQNLSNIEISDEVIRLAKSGMSVPTDHLCFAAWILWQMGRSGQYGFRLQSIFNKHQANWLASDVANEFLSEIFPDTGQKMATAGKNVGRNDPCPCGSGKKFKKCCGQ